MRKAVSEEVEEELKQHYAELAKRQRLEMTKTSQEEAKKVKQGKRELTELKAVLAKEKTVELKQNYTAFGQDGCRWFHAFQVLSQLDAARGGPTVRLCGLQGTEILPRNKAPTVAKFTHWCSGPRAHSLASRARSSTIQLGGYD